MSAASNGGTEPYLVDPDVTLYQGDALEVLRKLPDESIDCCVTSPPYLGLRDYKIEGQIGLEPTIAEYVEAISAVMEEVRRVLRGRGTLWLNLGDSFNAYNGGAGPGSKLSRRQTEARPRLATGFGLQQKELKPKDLMMVPARVALALQAAGWWLRSEIVWHKPAPMPESIRDRPTKAHEMIYLLAKSSRYHYDADAIAEPSVDPESLNGRNPRNYDAATTTDPDGEFRYRKGFSAIQVGRTYPTRNARDVWTMNPQHVPGAHFATFPEELPRRCIAAGCPDGGVVLDPFAGSGTTLLVARKSGRRAIGIELNPSYCDLASSRLAQQSLLAEIA